MQALQRTFLLSIILFIVLTSTLQSMIEITDPIILALGASRNRYQPLSEFHVFASESELRKSCKIYIYNFFPFLLLLFGFRSLWKHFRGLSMCLLLLVFPVFMAYKISQFFHMDFWLLILVSSCMLTSLQVCLLSSHIKIIETLCFKSCVLLLLFY